MIKRLIFILFFISYIPLLLFIMFPLTLIWFISLLIYWVYSGKQISDDKIEKILDFCFLTPYKLFNYY